ncbi:hypothetical protein TSAR_006503 [Trichomalopsis sarcophagae]|uniref:Uncharacterized protein n=1 Tax=Trichomalopsis sarcophagae TaxID=543379 RepID=A0A232EZX7_9HYME|nr:hypothetical protein TSAR_006503 [Trichomalopsis sarcophagae]
MYLHKRYRSVRTRRFAAAVVQFFLLLSISCLYSRGSTVLQLLNG